MSLLFPFLSLSLFILSTTHFSHAFHQTPSIPTTTTTTRASSDGRQVTMELWCVAKNNAEDSALLSAIDWACGPGGSDCSRIQQGGPCYDPSDVQLMASVAFNDYFLNHGLTEDSCSFSGTAALTSLDPSRGSCKFPSSSSVHNGTSVGSSTVVGVGPSNAGTSGGSYFAGTLCLYLIIVHFFFAHETNILSTFYVHQCAN